MSSLAPFESHMYPGQGYNSYTQKLCFAKAVTITPAWKAGNTPKSQKTTFTWDYVSKFSDISRSIGVAAALTINAGGFSGTAKGDFINEESTRNSDIRFLVKSKVINLFDPIDREMKFNLQTGTNKDNFLENYGDSFIEGFEEGGEFLAMVNVTIHDSSKKTEIKGEIEAGLKAIQAKGRGAFKTGELESKAKFAISVYAVGGKALKPTGNEWNISSMLDVATRFPQDVWTNGTPLLAITRDYTAASGFISLMKTFETSPYSIAQSLTDSWLDDFTTFNAIATEIEKMQNNLEKYVEAEGTDVYELTEAGLLAALEDSRNQKTAIAINVKTVEKDPTAATAEPEDKFKYTKPNEIRRKLPVLKVAPPIASTTLLSMSGSSLACCNILDSESRARRLYWQHENGSIMESSGKNLEWNLDHSEVADSALPNTPIAVIADEKGEKIRVYFLNKKAHICERVGKISSKEWSDGDFNDPKVAASPLTSLAAYRHQSGRVHLFYQDKDNKLQHEVLEPGTAEWTLQTPPADKNAMVPGSSLAVVGNTKIVGVAPIDKDSFSVFFQASSGKWAELFFDAAEPTEENKWKTIDNTFPAKLAHPGACISTSFVAGVAEAFVLYPSNEIWTMKSKENNAWTETSRVSLASKSTGFAVSHWSEEKCRIYVSRPKGVMELVWDETNKAATTAGEIGAPRPVA